MRNKLCAFCVHLFGNETGTIVLTIKLKMSFYDPYERASSRTMCLSSGSAKVFQEAIITFFICGLTTSSSSGLHSQQKRVRTHYIFFFFSLEHARTLNMLAPGLPALHAARSPCMQLLHARAAALRVEVVEAAAVWTASTATSGCGT